MEPDPREPTGDLGYDMAHEDMAHEDMAHEDMAHEDMAHEDMAHEVTGDRHRPQEGTPQTAPVDDAGDHGYDEAHDFRR